MKRNMIRTRSCACVDVGASRAATSASPWICVLGVRFCYVVPSSARRSVSRAVSSLSLPSFVVHALQVTMRREEKFVDEFALPAGQNRFR